MTPAVSVIVPCYNGGPFVGETLESVLTQTWPNLQIIVVDDGSTDDSAQVVRSFGDDRIKLISQANRGQTAALNAGLAHATGAFVQYLDADDVIDPDKISRQMARLADRPDCVASSEWGRFYGDPKETTFVQEDVYRDLNPVDWLTTSRSRGLGMMFPALWLLPMQIVRAAGPWREDLTLNNDAEYFTRVLLHAEQVLFCQGARCRYRSGLPNSLSGQKAPQHWKSQFEVLHLCEGYLRSKEDSERVRRSFAFSWQHFAHACYPYHARLARLALARAAALDSTVILPDGGPAFRILSRAIGWKAARWLQVASGRP